MADRKTYADALQLLSQEITKLMPLPDANLPFIVHLLEEVVTEMRSPELAMSAAGILPSAGGNPQGAAQLGMPPGAGGGMPPLGPPGLPLRAIGTPGMSGPPPSQLGMGVGGAGPQMGPGAIPPDVMRQILSAGNQPGPPR